MENSLGLEILKSRLLTCFADCDACREVNLIPVEDLDPQEMSWRQFKSTVMQKTEDILCNAEDEWDGSSGQERTNLEAFIKNVIKFREKCFQCAGNHATMYEMHKQIVDFLEKGKGKTIFIRGS